jgi:hypothetical protein
MKTNIHSIERLNGSRLYLLGLLIIAASSVGGRFAGQPG